MYLISLQIQFGVMKFFPKWTFVREIDIPKI